MTDRQTSEGATTVPGAELPERIRLIALDVDGTLLRSDKRLSPAVAEAVAEACARGVHVVLASARPPRTVRALYEGMGLRTPQVNYNGALVHDPLERRHLLHVPLCERLTGRIVRFARELDPQVVVSIEILDKWYTDRVDPTLLTQTAREQGPDHIGPIESFPCEPVTKLMLLAPPERLGRLKAAIGERFGQEAALLMSDAHLLQVVHREVDKAAAVAWVAGRYGISADQVMAVGDAGNDVGMLRWAGWGVAVANAWGEVRAAADAVVASNDEDGVAYAIRRFVLERADSRR